MGLIFSASLAPREQLLYLGRYGSRNIAGLSRNPVAQVPRHEMHEDSAAIAQKDGVTALVVADGVGGCPAGEIASSQAVSFLLGEFYDNPSILENNYLELFYQAQKSICQVGGMYKARRMKTTFEAATVRGNFGVFAKVGDSRTYHIRGEVVRLLMPDHSTGAHLFAGQRQMRANNLVLDTTSAGLLPQFYQEMQRSSGYLINVLGDSGFGCSLSKANLLKQTPELKDILDMFFCFDRRKDYKLRPNFIQLLEENEITLQQRQALLWQFLSFTSTQPDIISINLSPGDIILMCSDGLNCIAWQDFYRLAVELSRYEARKQVELLNAAAVNPQDSVTMLVYEHL